MKYLDLIVWQKAINFVQEIYDVTAKFPSEEKFGLTVQLRRAAVSIPSNIAEGHGRKSTAVFINHISIAFGSLMEIETQMHIAHRLQYIHKEILEKCLNNSEEIGKMLSGLTSSLKKRGNDA